MSQLYYDEHTCPVCDRSDLEEADLCPTLEVCHTCLHQHDGLSKLVRSVEASVETIQKHVSA